MLYLTFNGGGQITGLFNQALQPEHAAAHIEVTQQQAAERFSYIVQGGLLVTAPPGTYAAPISGEAAFRAMKEREAQDREDAGDELGALQLRLKHKL